MVLEHEPDLSVASWITEQGDSWVQLACFGSSGFARYGRLVHILYDGVTEPTQYDLDDVSGHVGAAQLAALTRVLARHTSTPDRCYFGLWDGYGDIWGSPSLIRVSSDPALSLDDIPHAFPPDVMGAPRWGTEGRDYFLFRGPLSEAGVWPAAEVAPGEPRVMNSPSLMWPSDRAWFTASDTDQPWTGVAGSAALIEELLADPELDFTEADPTGPPPLWR